MTLIVSVDEHWGIGRDGDQLCYIRADLKRFQALTTGHCVLLGRKTLQTFPGGRPLKNRRNLILSTDPTYTCEGAETCSDLADALRVAPPDTFVIGGESVYRQALPFCDTALVTAVHHTFDADRFFPSLDSDPNWVLEEESALFSEGELSYSYRVYRRMAQA